MWVCSLLWGHILTHLSPEVCLIKHSEHQLVCWELRVWRCIILPKKFYHWECPAEPATLDNPGAFLWEDTWIQMVRLSASTLEALMSYHRYSWVVSLFLNVGFLKLIPGFFGNHHWLIRKGNTFPLEEKENLWNSVLFVYTLWVTRNTAKIRMCKWMQEGDTLSP